MCGPLDLNACHETLSAQCFNDTWTLLDKPVRTELDDDQMLMLALTSRYHWTKRPDVTEQNLSIAAWLISRVFIQLGQADNALHWGQRAHQAFEKTEPLPFYAGYAQEAVARAHALSMRWDRSTESLELARGFAAEVSNQEFGKMLLDDLATIPLKA